MKLKEVLYEFKDSGERGLFQEYLNEKDCIFEGMYVGFESEIRTGLFNSGISAPLGIRVSVGTKIHQLTDEYLTRQNSLENKPNEKSL
ncbi:hypothetical protein HOD29_06430 [archaeon]|jgi:hypothetical protein|nr:hypothetical protein [archaeon]